MMFEAPESRIGFPISLGAHVVPGLVLVIVGLFFGQPKPFELQEESIPVEVLTENQLREITRGVKTAKEVIPNAPQKVDKVAELRKENEPGEAKKDNDLPLPPRKQEAATREEPKPAEAKPAEAKPAEAKPAEPKAAEAKPVVSRSPEPVKPAEPPKIAALPTPVPLPSPRPLPQPDPVKRAEPKAAEEDEEDKPDAETIKDAKKAPPKPKEPPKEPPKVDPKVDPMAKLIEQQKQQEKAEQLKKLEQEQKRQAAAEAKREAEAEAKLAAEEEKKLEEKKLAEKKAAEKKLADAKKAADEKKATEDRKRREAEANQPAFDPDAIRNKVLASREKPASTASIGPVASARESAGTPTAQGQKLSPSDREWMLGKIRDCFNDRLSTSATAAEWPNPKPVIRVELRPDGSMAQATIANSGSHPQFRPVAEAGIRTARQCFPISLPARFASSHADWRFTNVTLSPPD